MLHIWKTREIWLSDDNGREIHELLSLFRVGENNLILYCWSLNHKQK